MHKNNGTAHTMLSGFNWVCPVSPLLGSSEDSEKRILPFYNPPEHEYCKASDIYNFASLVLKTSMHFFGVQDINKNWQKKNIDALPVHFPSEVRSLLKKCLSQNVEDRLSAIGTCLDSIQDFQTNPPLVS